MAVRTTVLSAFLLVAAMQYWRIAAAQSACTMAIVSLSPCMSYVTGNSTAPTPSCCSRLSSVVTSQPQCLCALLKGGASNFGIVVNQTQALALPGACDVKTPPVSRCDGDGNGDGAAAPAPAAGAPAETPDGDEEELPQVPTTPSESGVPAAGGGSKTVPSTEGTSGGGSGKGAALSFVGMMGLIVASSIGF